MIERAAEHSRPRYTLHIDGQLTAIVQTGDDDLGSTSAGVAQLLERLPHPKPVQALMTSPPQPRDVSLAAALCGRGRPASVFRGPWCAPWRARVPACGGHRLRAPSPINRSAGRPV